MRSELQNIVDELASKLRVPTSLTDSQFNSIVFGPHEDADIDQIRRQALLNRQTSPEVRDWFASFGTTRAEGPLRIPADPAISAKSRVVIPARWGTVTYGFLCLLDDGKQLSEQDISLAVEAIPEIARLLLRQHRDRQRGADTLYSLLSPVQSERDEAAADLQMTRGTLNSRVAVLRFAPTIDELTVERSVDDLLRRRSSRTHPAIRLVESGRAVFLLMATPAERAYSLMAELSERLLMLGGGDLVVLAGIGNEFSQYTEASVSLHQAELATRAAAALSHGPSHVAEWAKLGALRMLVSLPLRSLPETIDPRFLMLLQARDATLVPTLEVYLDQAANVQKSAELLGIHRGTLYYRLRRTQEISGFDLSNGLDVLSLHLAIKSRRFLPESASEQADIGFSTFVE